VDGRPVAKRSSAKESRGGRKTALRRHKPTGTALEEVVLQAGPVEPGPHDRLLAVPLLRGGTPVDGAESLEQSRDRLRRTLVSVPWEGLKLSRGEPAIPTVYT
jgi:nicotinate phosphoribosyltransferase